MPSIGLLVVVVVVVLVVVFVWHWWWWVVVVAGWRVLGAMSSVMGGRGLVFLFFHRN